MRWTPIRICWNSMRMNWNSCTFLLSKKSDPAEAAFFAELNTHLAQESEKLKENPEKVEQLQVQMLLHVFEMSRSVSNEVGQWQQWLLLFLVLPNLARKLLWLTLISNGNSGECSFHTRQYKWYITKLSQFPPNDKWFTMEFYPLQLEAHQQTAINIISPQV